MDPIRNRWLTPPIPGPGKNEPSRPQEPLSVGVPLAKLIKRKLVAGPELVMLGVAKSLGAEAFHRLKTRLTNQEAEAQVIVVTSAGPGDGKTTVSINLALAFATERSERTLLIDGDLRRPSVQVRLRPEPSLGLGEVIAGRAAIDDVVLTLETSPLEILPAIRGNDDPVQLLSSPGARQLIETLRGTYRRIVIDTPPIVPFTDADVLGGLSDGVLLVVRAG